MAQTPETAPPSQPENPKTSKPVSFGVSFGFEGPLPPPGLLKGYEEVCPGAADRIIKMAEDQGQHRRRMEEKAMNTSHDAMRLGFMEGRIGQGCALVVALAFIGAGVWIAKLGNPWTGTVLSASGVAVQTLIASFIRKQNQVEPPKANPQPPLRKGKKAR